MFFEREGKPAQLSFGLYHLVQNHALLIGRQYENLHARRLPLHPRRGLAVRAPVGLTVDLHAQVFGVRTGLLAQLPRTMSTY